MKFFPFLSQSLFLALLFLLSVPVSPAGAITPVWQYNDLVAGEGEAGYKDGPFYQAQFNHPTGLALSADGSKLYVADRDNHCVRQVDLENNNAVTTLAGTGKTGSLNGPLLQATFISPLRLLALPENRLLVYDDGDQSLRLLDLAQNKTSLFFNNASPEAKGTFTGAVGSMVYDPKDNVIYLTKGALSLCRLNLKTKEFTVFSHDHLKLPNPLALSWYGGKLCVADTHQASVFQVDFPANTLSAVSLTEITKGDEIVSLVSSGKTLYGFQASDSPWVKLAPRAEAVTLMSVWGPFLEAKSKELDNLLYFKNTYPPGAVAAPGEDQRLFVSSPQSNAILSLRDYSFWEYRDSREAYVSNTNGLRDFTYPEAKPPHTFRILLLGDSHIYYEKEGSQRWKDTVFNRQETVGKKLEFSLNFEASLRDSSTHFQVLDLAYERYSSLFLWPYIMVPSFLKKFDVDMVLLIFPADYTLSSYFECPYLKKEGIPDWNANDGEYRLKPLSEKLAQDPVLKDFYERVQAHQWVTKNKWDFDNNFAGFMTDPRMKEDLYKLTEKPLGLFRDYLKGYKNKEGKEVSFHTFFIPLGGYPNAVPNETYRHFWTDITHDMELDFTDLMDPFIALRTSAYPTTEFWGFYHFDENGHTLFSYLLSREILKHDWLPFPTDKK